MPMLSALALMSVLVAAPAPPGVDGPVHALAADSAGVVVGGSFSSASGVPAANIARWDGAVWEALGGGTNGPVRALFVDEGVVYAGGEFTSAGGVAVHNLAAWDGAQWSDVGDGVSGGVGGADAVVQAIARDPGGILVGGIFATVGVATPANGLARWTGSAWNVLGGIPPGIAHDIRTIVYHGNTIFVGGVLFFPGSTRPSEGTLARATPFVLSDYAGSANADDECTGCASVDAIVSDGTNFFVAGAFTRLGDVTALGSPYEAVELANGVTPVGLGDGVTLPSVAGGGVIRALALSSVDLYAGGNIAQIRGVAVGFVARWNGNAWTPLGTGTSGQVRALTVGNDIIFAGGDFVTAGGVTVNHVARWDGSAWSALANSTTPVEKRSLGTLKAIYR